MALEVEGIVYKVLPSQTGSGKNGNWVKQEFVIETQDQYPKKVCFSAWGDKVDLIKALNLGDKIKVSFNVESREYNERWYTDLRMWKLDSLTNGPSTNDAIPGANDVPFVASDDSSDDLPF